MTNRVQESFGNYVAVGANAAGTLIASGEGAVALGGFVCSTSGTLTLTEGSGGSILASTPVTAGVVLPLPVPCPKGCIYQLGGGASGTFLFG